MRLKLLQTFWYSYPNKEKFSVHIFKKFQKIEILYKHIWMLEWISIPIWPPVTKFSMASSSHDDAKTGHSRECMRPIASQNWSSAE